MERREHRELTKQRQKYYYFSKWDYCKPCGHLQHYEKFKVLNENAQRQEEENSMFYWN